MINGRGLTAVGLGILLVASARADVRVFIQDTNGMAVVNYQCTAGEIVRAFALDVSVDQGQIIGISGFFRGPCTTNASGYGIFPASFRDNLMAAGTNVNWASSNYSPVGDVADAPGDTLPGLNSSGVTLEFGGLWNPNLTSTFPASSGTLCVLQLSQSARVSVAANVIRGGIVSAFPETTITPVFVEGLVGPAVISATYQNGSMTIVFQGGQLQSASSLNGPWTNTGDVSGNHVELVGTNQTRFYRVGSP